jgi:phospholipid/cholesterol/gamma-HCH transport system substrate-binding protein
MLVLALVAGIVVVARSLAEGGRTHLTAYFDNSNGMFVGDEVRILGVPVGAIEAIEPQSNRAKVSLWVDDKYKVPADAKAVVLSQQLITSRAIQLTPAYNGGPAMANGAVIGQDRTVVPIEWDDLRQQLQKLTDMLQPTKPGGVSTLGEFINTAADNLRGQGATIRDTVIKLSQAFSILGDHSNDVFATIKNLSIVVSALQGSTDLMKRLNRDLAAVTALLADDPNKVGQAVTDLNDVAGNIKDFVPDVTESLGTTIDRVSSISKAIYDSLDDIKQTLHVAPTAFQNLTNIYAPAQAALTGALVVNNFANPITFLCGAIQAASRLGNEQSAKLCVQYLAPIIKNRQYNFPPLGENLIVGAVARPNEVTYSEDWMRPDYVPPAAPAPPASGAQPGPSAPGGPPLAAEVSMQTDPNAGLAGMMAPRGGGQ